MKYFDNSKSYKVYKNLKPCYKYTGEQLKNYDEPEIYKDCIYTLDKKIIILIVVL